MTSPVNRQTEGQTDRYDWKLCWKTVNNKVCPSPVPTPWW